MKKTKQFTKYYKDGTIWAKGPMISFASWLLSGLEKMVPRCVLAVLKKASRPENEIPYDKKANLTRKPISKIKCLADYFTFMM